MSPTEPVPEVPVGRVLLHTCCAPCSCAIIEWMLGNGYQPTIYYCNPNIYPEEEYLRRKAECTRFVRSLGLTIIDADYDHAAWLASVQGLEDAPERGPRCLQCFKFRLIESARYALKNGFPLLTTTLASSRWKSLDQINEAGAWAVETALAEYPGNEPPHAGRDAENVASLTGSDTGSKLPPLIWWDKNWRKGGLQERRGALLKEYNFYNQLWCGCEFSQRN